MGQRPCETHRYKWEGIIKIHLCNGVMCEQDEKIMQKIKYDYLRKMNLGGTSE